MDAVLREPMQNFLEELINGAPDRKEILHFVTAREMANIIVAACDGREGNPGDYRDYRYKLGRARLQREAGAASEAAAQGLGVRG